MSTTFTPRLATSRQWTELPSEFLSKVRLVFDNQFKAETALGEFIVDGRIYPEEVLVRVGYLEHGRLKQINFEASMDLAKAKAATGDQGGDQGGEQSSTMELLYVCIDSLGSLMEEYFQIEDGDELDVPNYWRAYEFEGDTVYLQHSTLNTKLESEADRLLGLEAKKLFNDVAADGEPGGASSEDALAKAEIDADLAFQVQELIRSGKYKADGIAHDEEDELN